MNDLAFFDTNVLIYADDECLDRIREGGSQDFVGQIVNPPAGP